MSDTNNLEPQPAESPDGPPSLEGGSGYVGPVADRGPDVDELILGGPQERDSDGRPSTLFPISQDVLVEQDPTLREVGGTGTSDRPASRRRIRLPLILFIATCLSTFWVGANHWFPLPGMGTVRQSLLAHWQDGLIYSGCLLTILLAHEMGHFVATLRYRIPASFPYFIPFPISPIGTMGAVIGMDGLRQSERVV